MGGVGGVIGQDRNLGRAGFGVDAHLRTADPLGGRDIDVAGSGDHVDRREFAAIRVGAPVGQQRDGLRATDRPHFVDAQQRCRRQDRRVRQALEVGRVGGLGRAGDDQRVHARGLGRNDVHHDARRVHRVAAGNVEPDPLDGHPAFGHRRTGRECGGGVGATLIGVHGAGALDGDVQCGADVRVQRRERGCELLGRDTDAVGAHTVERGAVLQGGRRTAVGDRVDDRPDRRHHRVDVDTTAGQGATQPGRRQRGTAQVDASQRPWR